MILDFINYKRGVKITNKNLTYSYGNILQKGETLLLQPI